jgi:peroxiredoxin
MNRIAAMLSVAAGVAFALAPAYALAVSAGQAAPDFSIADTQGKTVSLADYRGKYVVLEWTNPDCPFVRRHYQSRNMPELQKDWSARGVVWVSIDSSNRSSSEFKTAAQLDAWMHSQGAAQTEVLVDAESATAKLYGAKTTPHMFVIDPEGRIIYAGAIDDKPWASPAETSKAKNYVRAALVAATSGTAVDPANTTPYGCSIKY